MDITLNRGMIRWPGWGNGAHLREIWFSRPANDRPERGEPERSTIRRDRWVLTFQRALVVCQDMVRNRAWCNEAPQRDIGNT